MGSKGNRPLPTMRGRRWPVRWDQCPCAVGRRGRGGQGGHEPRMRIRAREIRALELVIRGWSQHRIAADLGVSQAAVSKLLARVEGRELRERVATLDRHRIRQTLRLDHGSE